MQRKCQACGQHYRHSPYCHTGWRRWDVPKTVRLRAGPVQLSSQGGLTLDLWPSPPPAPGLRPHSLSPRLKDGRHIWLASSSLVPRLASPAR